MIIYQINKTFLVSLMALSIITAVSALEVTKYKPIDPVGHFHQLHLLAQQEEESHLKSPKTTAEEETEGPLVTVPAFGTAQGTYITTFLGRQVSAFRGIPYAFQPERFQYPDIFTGSWTDDGSPFDATTFGERCPQPSLVIDDIVSGSEDCLQVSIYSPYLNFDSPFDQLLPVMIFIHGGAYLSGEATYYIPTKLMDKDVVVVVLQYRLGTLGFLYSGTDDAPGNMGLMDQITAIQWTKNNIESFGGNSSLMTVFGQSAGGASTSMMQMTPLTQAPANNGEDLIQRFIPMSGSAIEYWTLDRSEGEGFLKQVEAIGCQTDGQTPEEMVNCMKSHTLSEIVHASVKVYQEDRVSGGLGFIGQAPVVQTDSLNVPIVLPKEPIDIAHASEFLSAPVMTGACRDEGSLVMGLYYTGFLLPNEYFNDTAFIRDDLLPGVAETFGIYDPTNAVANTMRLGFFPEDVEMGNLDDMLGPLVDLGGTLFLKSGLWSLSHALTTSSKSNPVYFYSFEFESDDSLFKWVFPDDIPVTGGITHGDDLLYLFSLPANTDEREAEMVRRMTTLYTNFAKYGVPTPEEVEFESEEWSSFCEEWLPYSADKKNFMLLKDQLTLEEDFVLRWNYNKFGYNVTRKEEVMPSNVNPASQKSAEPSGDGNNGNGAYGNAALIVGAVCASLVILVATFAFAVQLRRSKKNRPSIHSQGAVNIAMDTVSK